MRDEQSLMLDTQGRGQPCGDEEMKAVFAFGDRLHKILFSTKFCMCQYLQMLCLHDWKLYLVT